jgi:hypothetical protein
VGQFRRKTTVTEERERRPRCAEPVPEGADVCAICGVDLRPLRPSSLVGQEEKARTTV